MYTNNKYDPLFAYESAQKRTSFLKSFQRTCSFLISYLLLSGSIFLVLLVGLNYSAYSKVIINWVDPNALIEARDEVNKIIASATSVSVHAADRDESETQENLDSITTKIRNTDPSVIYSRKYAPRGLIANTKSSNPTVEFELTPYENRIIIPRINKNIPLVDVSVSSGASFETMHEVFMEELKK